MRPLFNIKTLAIAIITLSAASAASAAGMDRSGQDITAFLQEGTYVETVYSYIDADVSGHDNVVLGNDPSNLSNYSKGNSTGDIAEAYDFFRFGVKADINDTFSVGILYDEPFGASAEYNVDSNFVSGDREVVLQNLGVNIPFAQVPATIGALVGAGKIAEAKALGSAYAIAGGVDASKGEGTKVEVRTENLTGILGMKFGENFQVYGGPVIQRLHADVALRGPAYLTSAGYTAHISPTDGYGWLGGVVYSRPEIALKAALTYRSEIDHEDANIGEELPSLDYLGATGNTIKALADKNGRGSMEITTPESFNFNFQTGINPTTLATAKVRYVPWGEFAIVPPLYNAATTSVAPPNGLPLVDYSDDQWQVELGLAKRLNPSLAVSGTVGWDSGAGNPTTSLGPIEGYYSVGAGAKLNVTENWAISAGAKYLMFGDSEGALPNGKVVSRFEDNDGYVAGVKLSYQAK